MTSETKIENLIKYEKLFKDNIIRENYIRLVWPENWQWYIDLLSVKLQESNNIRSSNFLLTLAITPLKKLKQITLVDEDIPDVSLPKEREKVVADYKRCSPKALALGNKEKADERSVLPFPKTTSGEYGWLSTRKEFELEVYGGYYDALKSTAKPPDALSSYYSTSH